MPIPVLLDTDIGTDIDDAYALILAAASPELELVAVTTVNGDTTLRARIASGLLRFMGRSDVPVFAGERRPLASAESRGWMGHEGRGMNLAGADSVEIRSDAPAAIARMARATHDSGRPMVVLPIGAMTNLAVAFERYPDDMALISRIVAMASDFGGFGDENARPEHNVACDPEAVQRVLSSGVPVTLVGLNVTRQTAMTSEDVEELATVGGPLAEALVGMHRIWFDTIGDDRSPMHDGLAVAAALRPDLIALEAVDARVLLDSDPAGTIAHNRPAKGEVTRHQVAVSVDAAQYHRLLRDRVLSAAAASRNAQFSKDRPPTVDERR